LCPEAEMYVSQDEVEWEETPRKYDGNRIWREPTQRYKEVMPELTLREAEVLKTILVKMPIINALELLDMTRNTYDKHKSNIRKKLKKILQ
jgi:FixJ family two-component response regulator